MNFGLSIYIKEVLFYFNFFFLHAHSKVNKEIKHLIGGEDPLVHSVN